VAVAFWPIHTPLEAWKVELDVDYVRWRSLRNADVHFSNGSILADPLHWRNAVSAGFGTEYSWWAKGSAWKMALRTGYFYSMAAVPNEDFSPVVPMKTPMSCRGALDSHVEAPDDSLAWSRVVEEPITVSD
jgi:long-chain fatty acid transport protein